MAPVSKYAVAARVVNIVSHSQMIESARQFLIDVYQVAYSNIFSAVWEVQEGVGGHWSVIRQAYTQGPEVQFTYKILQLTFD